MARLHARFQHEAGRRNSRRCLDSASSFAQTEGLCARLWYPFILEALAALEPELRPMFSSFAVYVGEKIVLMLRDSPKQPKDNGAWLVFSETANLADLRIRRDFPSLLLIKLLGSKIGHWRLIPTDSATFESEALHACELLLKHDVRFGRIPQSRQTHPAWQRRRDVRRE